MLKYIAKLLRGFVDRYAPQPAQVLEIERFIAAPLDPMIAIAKAFTDEAELEYATLSGQFRRRKVAAVLAAAYPELPTRRINLLIEQALN